MLDLYPYLYVLAIIVGSIYAFSGITDFVFDIYYIYRAVRRFLLSRNWPKLTLERLEAREQQKIAIIIAAWHEEDVIAQTLTNACETIRYRNYDIFVGTYPNDPATQSEVDRIAQKYLRVHKVVTADDGPTNKAANLNQVFQAIKEYEQRKGQRYEIILMHDSEDVIHPYSLLVCNYLIPRMDMIQIPVFPMDVSLRNVTYWTYADEFAENHTKLLLVRELTGGFVPSAGVGTAFTKRAFQLMALVSESDVFNPGSLTEDYELGLRMNLRGIRAAFVLVNIPSPKSLGTGKRNVADWVATRAVFPLQFRRAVRQKTRWNIGIVLQGWQNLGWQGNLPVRWNLFQDRKALLTTPANFLGYFVFLYFVIYQILVTYYAPYMPPLIEKGTLLWYLAYISTVFMIWRSGNRAFAVNKIYGFWPAVTSIPRSIWGNVINFFAMTRAVWQFSLGRMAKKQVALDKTEHEFPSEVIEEGKAAAEGAMAVDVEREESTQIDADQLINDFLDGMTNEDQTVRVKTIRSVNRKTGPFLYPYLISYIEDTSWRVRSEVCRTLSFLRYAQAIPYLEKAAADPDWAVRSNAVRALGKLGDLGESVLVRILKGHDRYASDAAQAILEHQGFFERNIKRLLGGKKKDMRHALLYFSALAEYGKSSLAKEVIDNYVEGKLDFISILISGDIE
ncbi:MAG TPA: phage adsorption protein NrfB [Anaerolineae bacterium]|nr:phage adsorption protein NrfB [Anaerolineae bacterium]